MNLGSPKKLVGRDRVYRDRQNEKSDFVCREFPRAITEQEQKHPRKQNHRVAIRELPAARIAVAP